MSLICEADCCIRLRPAVSHHIAVSHDICSTMYTAPCIQRHIRMPSFVAIIGWLSHSCVKYTHLDECMSFACRLHEGVAFACVYGVTHPDECMGCVTQSCSFMCEAHSSRWMKEPCHTCEGWVSCQ